jgi:hypothetical protein
MSQCNWQPLFRKKRHSEEEPEAENNNSNHEVCAPKLMGNSCRWAGDIKYYGVTKLYGEVW